MADGGSGGSAAIYSDFRVDTFYSKNFEEKKLDTFHQKWPENAKFWRKMAVFDGSGGSIGFMGRPFYF